MWIKAHASLARHPKTKRMARMLGISDAMAVGPLFVLWWWAMEYAQDGDLSDFTDEEIASAAGWDGDPSSFVSALVECGGRGSGFLDRTEDGGLILHEWDEHCGETFDKRDREARRLREYRARRKAPPHEPSANDVRTQDSDVRVQDEDVRAHVRTPYVRGERRGEEKRGEEKRGEETSPPYPPHAGGSVEGPSGEDRSCEEGSEVQSAPAEKPPFGGGARPQDGNGATGTGAALSLLPPGGTALEDTPDIAPPVAEAGVGMADGDAGDAKTETGPKRPNDGPPGFRAFWAVYPRKVQKGPALKAWLALSRQGVPFEDIAEAAREYAKASQAKGTPPDRILHPATFLHEDRWRDWLPPDGASYREALGLASRPRASPPSRQGSGSIAYLKGLSRDEVDAILKTRPLYPQTGQSAVMGPSIDADSREIGA